MIEVYEAIKLIRQNLSGQQKEYVDISKAGGRVLSQDILADRPGPPFNRVAMDGIGIKLDQLKNGQVEYPIEGMQAAGAPQLKLSSVSHCIETMTGAVLPENCDAVIPFEYLKKEKASYIIQDIKIKEKMNVHQKSSDFKAGDTLVKKGTLLNEISLSIAASVGLKNIPVYRMPKVAIISTGSELVDIEEIPLDHQIRKSNITAAFSALQSYGFANSQTFHIADDLQSTKEKLESLLKSFDILILSGGVSKGKLDFIPEALKDLGVKKVFHKIAQKPGKPMWFGTHGNSLVYALPGNPVSLLVCLHRYVIPTLLESLGLKEIIPSQIRVNDLPLAKKNLTLFYPVKCTRVIGQEDTYHSVKWNGSGDFASLVHSDGFIEIPKGDHPPSEKNVFSFFPWSK